MTTIGLERSGVDPSLSSDDEGRGSGPVRKYDKKRERSGVDASLSSEDEGRGSVPIREYEQNRKPGTGTRRNYV